MWQQLERIIKSNGAIIMTAAQPFTTTLISSNMKLFRYDLSWLKSQGRGFYNANRMPLRAHEDIVVFYKKLPTYNPQKTPGKPYSQKKGRVSDVYVGKGGAFTNNVTGERFPLSYMSFGVETGFHPTQKPVSLMEYLIKTYTNPGETVLDFTMGSGTTGVACRNTDRAFIGIESDDKHFETAKTRILI